MGLCRKHPHSSVETARKCWSKTLGKRADKFLRGVQPLMYTQVKHNPPKLIMLGNIEVYYFYNGVPKTNVNTTK